jgi:hypothetical protein
LSYNQINIIAKMQLLTNAILLLLSCHFSVVSSSYEMSQITKDTSHMRGRKKKHSSKEEEVHMDRKMLEEYLEMWDEDLNDPPGPNKGWPHTEPFHMTAEEQKTLNEQLDEEMFDRQIDEMMMMMPNKQGRENDNLPFVHTTQIARPEGSDTAYYTGVTHFYHVNNPNLITLVFSAGRHDGGSNTYLTIDTSNPDANPFEAAQEMFIDKKDVSTYTWVSSYTSSTPSMSGEQPSSRTLAIMIPTPSISFEPFESPTTSEEPSSSQPTSADSSIEPSEIEDESVKHYALFSGGVGDGVVGPSKMYVFEEDSNGDLKDAQLVWVEEQTQQNGARYCLLADLGNIYNGDKLVSKKGKPDIMISGTGGLDIYSNSGNGWQRIRSLPLVNEATFSNPTGAGSYMGIVPYLDRYLVISSRSHWSIARSEQMPNSPCVIYDYQIDKVVQEFSPNAQTVSVDVLGNSEIIIGSGGNAGFSGQPNLLHEVSKDDMSLKLSDAQLVEDIPTTYSKVRYVDDTPTKPEEYFAIIASGLTKTRQVKSFSLLDLDIILEVNSAQPCNIYARHQSDNPSHPHKILPLPGSEGYIDKKLGIVHARGGDLLVIGDKVYVIIANFNGDNRVHSFAKEWLTSV